MTTTLQYPFDAYFRILSVVFSMSTMLIAADNRQSLVRDTAVVQNVLIKLTDETESPVQEYDKRIIYIPQTSTNETSRIYVPRQVEFFCEIALFDKNGKPVAKTKFGKRLGARFNEIKNSNSELRLKNYSKDLQVFILNIRPKGAANEAKIFYRPNELFNIENSGKYVLRLRFQLLKLDRRGSTNYFNLIRFPPVDYPVIKP